MKLVVGLTGGIASGKSYVSSYLKNLGYKIIDTDKISKELYSNKEYIKKINEAFPTCVKDNIIDKKLLKELVFSNSNKLNLLNNIAHPIIFEKTKKEIEASCGIIFIDAPLLFEASFDKICNLVVCVYTTKEIQLERLIKRDNISKEFAEEIIDNQMDVEIKKKKSDILVKSEEDFNLTDKNIDEMLERIKEYGKNIRD
jgi:dephospho-CoA kinase